MLKLALLTLALTFANAKADTVHSKVFQIPDDSSYRCVVHYGSANPNSSQATTGFASEPIYVYAQDDRSARIALLNKLSAHRMGSDILVSGPAIDERLDKWVIAIDFSCIPHY